MPVAITIDESKIFSVVIFIVNQVVEYHKAIDLPQFSHTMGQSRAELKDVSVVNAWQAIVSTYKTGNTHNVQLAVCRSIKTINTKVLIFKKKV